MRGTSGQINMMHRQQRQSSSFLRSNSSRGSNECRKIVSSSNANTSNNNNNNTNNNNNNNNVISSLSNDCTSPLLILSRRCSYNRSRTSTTFTTTSTPSSRCSTSTSTSSTSTCPVLLSVLAWSVTLLLISSCLGIADAGVLMGHPLGKRSFMQLQCKGIYDKSIFARLDRICEDCYNLFREPTLHTLCRKNCFTSDYFKGCLDVLLLQDEVEQIQTWIKQLHGADPGV